MDRTAITDEYIYSHLMEAILSGQLQKIADFAYELWRHPVKMIDPGYRFLAAAPRGRIGDRHWDVHVDSPFTPISLITECYQNDYRKKTLSGDGITYIDWGVDHPRLVGRVTVNKSAVAFIALCYMEALPPTPEEKEWDSRVLRIFCQAAAAVLMNDSQVSMLYKTEYDSLISMLFSGRTFSEEDQRYWESMSGLRLKPGYAVFAINVANAVKQGLDYFKAMLRPISAIIAYNFSDDFLYLLVCGVNGREQLTVYRDNMSTILNELETQAGCSELFDNINQLPRQSNRARRAYEIARQTGREEIVSVFDDVQQDLIIYTAVSHMDPDDYLPGSLRRLQEHDATANTQYFQTLRVYINSLCNTALTAEQLFIHRNTLQYRLNKICEVCDLNLEDVELCRKLLLAFMAIDMKDRLGH